MESFMMRLSTNSSSFVFPSDPWHGTHGGLFDRADPVSGGLVTVTRPCDTR